MVAKSNQLCSYWVLLKKTKQNKTKQKQKQKQNKTCTQILNIINPTDLEILFESNTTIFLILAYYRYQNGRVQIRRKRFSNGRWTVPLERECVGIVLYSVLKSVRWGLSDGSALDQPHTDCFSVSKWLHNTVVTGTRYCPWLLLPCISIPLIFFFFFVRSWFKTWKAWSGRPKQWFKMQHFDIE